ncbi:unnamed protein product [Paramecium primaurelia]|uniref:Uncharacterized protein n=1 Tax=Paramecium primaurelia TaxID=5886 RepID=A0A8S1PR10_PARPR|nr:unnamed protein product [Paramecium primaurelia]
MDNLLENKCSKHDQEFLAIRIVQDNKDQNKYLCPQCLIELINPKELILISEAKIQIQNKKGQISKNIEEQCKQKINLATNLKNSIQELKGPLEQIFTKINEEIDQFKNQTEKKIQESEIITPENLDTDLVFLTDEQINLTQSKTYENDLQLIKSLLNQFQFCEISSLSKQKIIEIISKCYDISKLQIETEDERNQKTKQTPSLKFLCQSHDQQIIMVQLDENSKFQQYSCVQCISEKQGKYITLRQLQQSLEAYNQCSEQSLKYCQQLREQHTNEIIKICKQLCDKYIQTINLQIQQLEINLKSFEKIIETNLQFKDQNIYQFEQEQLLQKLEPIYMDQNPNHYSKIIEKQLELDKQLYGKFEEQMQELSKFEISSSNLIKLEQLDHQLILKKIENQIGQQKSNQQNIQNDQEVVNLENEINSFLSKKLKQCILNEQFQQLFQNRDKLQNDQQQLIQNIVAIQDKLKEQQKNCAKEQGISQQYYENKIIYLERIKTQLNSTSFSDQIQKETQIQTNVTIASFDKEINEYKQKIAQNLQNIAQLEEKNQALQQDTLQSILQNSYQPQFNNSYKLAAYLVVNHKLVQSPQGGFGLAVMQPPLPKDNVTTFVFKINKCNSWAGVGICHLQTAQGFSYDMNGNYTSTNHNTYLACAGGYRISSYQGYTTGNNFTYGESSIIRCQYDPKNNKLNLLNINDGKTLQMDIANNNLEMSPCVMLYGAEIELI